MLKHSQENEERKNNRRKMDKNNPKCPFPRVGEGVNFFMFVTTTAMAQRSISKVSEKYIQSFSKNDGT